MKMKINSTITKFIEENNFGPKTNEEPSGASLGWSFLIAYHF